MDKYKQQQQHDSNFRRGKPMDEGRRRTKARKENETTKNNDDGSNGTNSNSKSCSLSKHLQTRGGIGGRRSRGRSPRPGFDLLTSVRCPNLTPRRAVNWRLACFMSNEYLTRGTLLGEPWPPQDSHPILRDENNYKSKAMSASFDKDDDEIRREKERLYHTLTDFLRAGDVHLPGIVNPSQLASWLRLN